MTLVAVDRADDDRLADYVRLREASLRRHLEAERGLFIAEGAAVVRRAVEAGYRLRSLLVTERWLPRLADLVESRPDVPVYCVTEAVAQQVAGFHVHRGALAALHRETHHSAADLLQARRLVVVEDVVDHTNLGAVVRCAAGLGWDGLLLSSGAADPLYRRAVRVSMGAVLTFPWARLPAGTAVPELLAGAGFVVAALTPADGARDLATVAPELRQAERVALLVGTEGAGLSAGWVAAADVAVAILMTPPVDSLNVAAAAAVACWAIGGSPP